MPPARPSRPEFGYAPGTVPWLFPGTAAPGTPLRANCWPLAAFCDFKGYFEISYVMTSCVSDYSLKIAFL